MTDETRAVGWYGTSKHSHLARHWDGKVWSRPVPRKEFGPGVEIHVDPTIGRPAESAGSPNASTHQQNEPSRKKMEIGCGTGCMMVILGLVVVGLLISWISTPFLASNNPRFTEESGLATCKELVAKQDNGQGNTTVMGSVLQGDRYKASFAVAGFSEAYRFTCRLEWSDDRWKTDILEGHEVVLPPT